MLLVLWMSSIIVNEYLVVSLLFTLCLFFLAGIVDLVLFDHVNQVARWGIDMENSTNRNNLFFWSKNRKRKLKFCKFMMTMQVGAIAPQSLEALQLSIHECLGSTDWATRKAAADSLSALALHSSNLIADRASSTITILEGCRFDRVAFWSHFSCMHAYILIYMYITFTSMPCV